MKDLDIELWKLGIPARQRSTTRRAPAQHELAPIYNTTNVATDENMLVMNVMKKAALRHGLVCLLHEKPFRGRQRKRQAQQLVADDGHQPQPARTGGAIRRKTGCSCSCSLAMMKAVDEHAGSSAHERRQPRQRPSPWRERSAARDHIHVPGRSAHRRGGSHHPGSGRKPCPSASIMRVGVFDEPAVHPPR